MNAALGDTHWKYLLKLSNKYLRKLVNLHSGKQLIHPLVYFTDPLFPCPQVHGETLTRRTVADEDGRKIRCSRGRTYMVEIHDRGSGQKANKVLLDVADYFYTKTKSVPLLCTRDVASAPGFGPPKTQRRTPCEEEKEKEKEAMLHQVEIAPSDDRWGFERWVSALVLGVWTWRMHSGSKLHKYSLNETQH